LRLMGLGMVCRLARNSFWSASQHLGFVIVTPVAPQDVAYAISYSLLVGAMLHLVALTTRRITLGSALDAGAVMLSVGTLAWYFVLGPAAAEAGLGSVREAVAALSQPACDAAFLHASERGFRSAAPRRCRLPGTSLRRAVPEW
jgi:hypothetical protein